MSSTTTTAAPFRPVLSIAQVIERFQLTSAMLPAETPMTPAETLVNTIARMRDTLREAYEGGATAEWTKRVQVLLAEVPPTPITNRGMHVTGGYISGD